MDFKNYGTKVKRIPVKLNYRIIELLSAGLYSSPNKAFEELISNSYDAYATEVCVFIPTEITNKSMLIVCDDGDSMNVAELEDLWQIGKSNRPTQKGKTSGSKKGRLPIGQFGIGKLATYVLADQLTYLCKKAGKIHLVTMDYNSIPKPKRNQEETIELDVLEIQEEKAKELIQKVLEEFDSPTITFELFGNTAKDTWTFAILSDIKDNGRELSGGMLSWIFSTALPVNPEFKLTFNNEPIQSSKLSGAVVKTWVIGKDDEVAKKNGYVTYEKNGTHYVDLPHLNRICGQVMLYEDTLSKGKSEKWGRSHGIFLKIRNRLINTDNPLLNGMRELNHATFNRMRFEINADELHSELTSGRELVKSSKKYKNMIDYIYSVFNKVHAEFDKWMQQKYSAETLSEKISNISPFYSKVPVYEAVKKVFDGTVSQLLLTRIPSNLNDKQKEEFLHKLDTSITDAKSQLIDDFSLDNDLDEGDPIAKLNLKTQQIEINTRHPFYISFLSEFKGKSNLPFSLIALNEIFTEVSLIEKGVDQEIIRDIIHRRDSLFREFGRRTQKNIFTATMFLKNSLSNQKDLEEALHVCFECLGFQVERMATHGTPEGKAIARLGIWKDGKREDYSFTYEAKSTKSDKIRADTTKTNVVNLHKEDHKADFALEVAIDYDGSEDPKSNANRLATNDRVTLVRAKDFWQLIIYSIPNQLSFLDFKRFLTECKTVPQSEKWIKTFCEKTPKRLPYQEILNAAWKIMNDDPKASPSIDTIRYEAGIKNDFNPEETKDMFKILQQMLPQLINIEGSKVRILLPPDKILETLNKLIDDQAPQELKKRFEDAFKKNLNGD